MKIGFILVLLLLMASLVIQVQAVSAIDFDEDISDEDKATFDKVLEPVMKIYNFVKYIATAIAVLVLVFAGINYMTHGSDPKKRDQAKNMIMYVMIGLFIIWAAPFLVKLIVG